MTLYRDPKLFTLQQPQPAPQPAPKINPLPQRPPGGGVYPRTDPNTFSQGGKQAIEKIRRMNPMGDGSPTPTTTGTPKPAGFGGALKSLVRPKSLARGGTIAFLSDLFFPSTGEVDGLPTEDEELARVMSGDSPVTAAMPPIQREQLRPSHVASNTIPGPFKIRQENGTMAFTDNQDVATKWIGRGGLQDKAFQMPDPNNIGTFNADAYLDRTFGPKQQQGAGQFAMEKDPTTGQAAMKWQGNTAGKVYDIRAPLRGGGSALGNLIGLAAQNRVDRGEEIGQRRDRLTDLAERKYGLEEQKLQNEIQQQQYENPAKTAKFWADAKLADRQAEAVMNVEDQKNLQMQQAKALKLADMLKAIEIDPLYMENPEKKKLAQEMAYAWANDEMIEEVSPAIPANPGSWYKLWADQKEGTPAVRRRVPYKQSALPSL
jgi:hypothetical protein